MIHSDIVNPFGAPVYHEETLASTMDYGRVLAGRGEKHGTVIVADFQEAGRGRLNRPWIVEKGKNLIVTILLRYADIASIPQALPLRTGLAVAIAIGDLIPSLSPRVKVKWPNDIMIGDRKASGILIEGDGKNVFAGIGVNVGQRDFPPDLQSKAVSLANACPDLPENARFLLLEKILRRLYEEIETDPFSLSWRERLLSRLYKKDEIVTFVPGAAGSNTLIQGTLAGIGEAGELLIIPGGEDKARAFINGELRVYRH